MWRGLTHSARWIREFNRAKINFFFARWNVGVELHSKSSCSGGQYGHSYGYQGSQQNVPLPGQLQPTTTIQPNLPGQSAQLHVTHHTPPGGVQTVHQTQVSAFGQSAATGGQQVQNVTREYVVPTPAAIAGQQMHQGIHQNPAQVRLSFYNKRRNILWLHKRSAKTSESHWMCAKIALKVQIDTHYTLN